MRYNLFINQPVAIELGMENTTEAHLFGELIIAPTWADELIVDGKVYYWVARQKICNALPLLNLKPDTVYRYMKKLDAKGIIEYKKLGRKDCIRITPLGKKYVTKTMSEKNPNFMFFTMSEKNPKKLGKKSEFTRKKIRHINILNNSIIKDTHTEIENDALFEKWLDEYSADKKTPPAYKANMRKRVKSDDKDAIDTFLNWKQNYQETQKKKELERKIKEFDYSSICGARVNGVVITNVITQEESSYIDLLLQDGSTQTFPKGEVYKWIHQKRKENE